MKKLLFALAVLGFMSSEAIAQLSLDSKKTTFRFSGPKIEVGIAGQSSGSEVISVGPGNGMIDGVPHAIRAVLIDETGDEPCGIRTEYVPLNTVPTRPVTESSWQDPDDENCEIEEVAWESRATPSSPPGFMYEVKNEGSENGLIGVKVVANPGNVANFVRQLSVCTKGTNNDRGDLVKGIRAVFVGLDPASGPTLYPTIPQSVQPHCEERDWTSSTCPDNHVATSLRVVTENIGNHRSITGIGLVCRPVELGFPSLAPDASPTRN